MFQPVPFIRTIGTYEGTKTLKRSVIVSKDDALCSERKVIFSLSNLLRSRESYSVSAHSWRGEEEVTRNSGKSTFDPQTGPCQGEGRLAGCSPPSPLFHEPIIKFQKLIFFRHLRTHLRVNTVP